MNARRDAKPADDGDEGGQLRPRPSADEPEPAFLPHPVMDRLVEVVLELGAELWIERDRRLILEQLLEDRGLLDRAAIEQYRDPPDRRAERDAERDRLVRRLYGALGRL